MKQQKFKEIRDNLLNMIATARKECRNLTDEEQTLFDEQKNELIALAEEIKAVNEKIQNLEASIPAEPESVEEKPAEEPVEEKAEEPTEEPVAEEPTEEEKPADNEEVKEEEPAEEKVEETEEKAEEVKEEKTEINKETKRNININMANKFSLVKALRNQIYGRPQDALADAILNEGRAEARSANMNYDSNFILPGETRAITVATEHDDIIETEFQSILEPLYAKSVLSELGVQFLTGLVGDVQIPVMTAGQVGWADEIDEAEESTNTFSNVKLSPKRITAVVKISKQLLAQDSIGVENAIRADIAKALASKIQQTFLSDAAATDVKPAGIFNGKEATYVANYKGLADFEAGLELANIDGEVKYVLSPAAKASLRAMTFGGKSTRMVYENGDIDGTPSTYTSDMAANRFAYGDWSNCVLAQWGGIEIVTDNYTLASAGQVRLVVNAYFDFVNKRPASILLGTVAVETPPADSSTDASTGGDSSIGG